VINEGPAFEAMLMTREMTNPQFRFLFDQQSPAHVYYRWRLFSILNGDSAFKWKTKPFKMFKHGSYWVPPPVNKYTQSVSDEAFDKAFSEFEIKKGAFSKEYAYLVL
jgi:U2-associated protein SR140